MDAMKSDPNEFCAALSFPRDYSHHSDAEIEWWYVFSFLNDRHAFMACFWRYHGQHWQTDGWMGAYSLIEVAGKNQWRGTWIDQPLFIQTREAARRILKSDYDAFLDAMFEATENGVVFKPFRLADAGSFASAEHRPVDVTIGPCRFYHDDVSQTLHLHIEEEELRVRLSLDVSGNWFPMNVTGTFDADGRMMWGYTHPRAATTGTVTLAGRTEEVSGISWFDHQWGEWLFDDAIGDHYHPMWNYYAILLDSGHSFVLYEIKSPGSNGFEKHMAYALLSNPDNTLRRIEAPAITCRDHVESLRTNNLYECGWAIECADLDCTLELVPLHSDQEIDVFLRQRGILELRCSVQGTFNGKACRGVCMVEVFGERLDINDFFWGQRKTTLARQLEKFMPRTFDGEWLANVCDIRTPLRVDQRAIADAIVDPIWSMMDRGGKGWRSAYLMICCQALGEQDVDIRIRDFLPVIEMLHTGSLIIDDIQDGSLLRRSQPALHTQIGEDLAINVGNFLYFLPLTIIGKAHWLSEGQRLAIYDIVTAALRQGHIGQAIDLTLSKGRYDLADKLAHFERTRDELIEQYRLKSGSQLEAVARIAGVVAQAPADLIEAAAEYSRVFGVVFQIIDDLIDIQEGKEKLGKDEGEDIRNFKLNMVLLHALSSMTDTARAELIRMIDEADGQEARRRIIDTIHETDAIDECIAFSEEMIDTAWRGLDGLHATDSKIIMRSVPKWLLDQRKIRRQESKLAKSDRVCR